MSRYLSRGYFERALLARLQLCDLSMQRPPPGCQVVVLHGANGLGKTALARQVLHQAAQWGYSVHWRSRPDLAPRTHLAALLQELERSPGSDSGPSERAPDRGRDLSTVPLGRLVEQLRAWGGQGRHLLVLDDVHSPEVLSHFLPGEGWSLLVTTTVSKLLSSLHVEVRRGGFTLSDLKLKPMGEDTAEQLLRQMVEARRTLTPADEQQILEIIPRAEGVPSHLRILGQRLADGQPAPASRSGSVVDQALQELDAAARQVADALAILPPIQLPLPILARVAGLPEEALPAQLATIERVGLLHALTPEGGAILLDQARHALRQSLKQGSAGWDELHDRLAAGLHHHLAQLAKASGTRLEGQDLSQVEQLIGHVLLEKWPVPSDSAPAAAHALLMACGLARGLLLQDPPRAREAFAEVERLSSDDRCSGGLALERAILCDHSGDHQEALRLLDEAAQHFTLHGERAAFSEVLLKRAWLRLRLGRRDDAKRDLDTLRRTYTADLSEAQKAQRDALAALVAIPARPGERDLRRLLFRLDTAAQDLEALEQREVAADVRYQTIEVLRNLRSSDHLCSPGAVLERVEAALGTLVGEELSHARARFLVIRGLLRRSIGDLDDAYQIFAEWKSHRGKVMALQARADLRLTRGTPEELMLGVVDISDALSLLVGLGDDLQEGELLLLSGNVALSRVEGSEWVKTALSPQEEAWLREAEDDLKRAEYRLGDTASKPDAILARAEVARLLGASEEAEDLYLKAETGYLESGDPRGRAEAASGRLMLALTRLGGVTPDARALAHRVYELGLRGQSDLALARADSVLRGSGARRVLDGGLVLDGPLAAGPGGLLRGRDPVEDIQVLVRLAPRGDPAAVEALETEALQLQRLGAAWLSTDGLARVVARDADTHDLALALDLGEAAPAEARAWTWEQLRVPLQRSLALLKAVHQEGLSHGDIGPHTLWFEPDGEPRLFGFRPQAEATPFALRAAADIRDLCAFALSLLRGAPVLREEAQPRSALDQACDALPAEARKTLRDVLLGGSPGSWADAEQVRLRLEPARSLDWVDGALRAREIEAIFAALQAGRHVLLDGPRGYGCSALVRAVAERLKGLRPRGERRVVLGSSRGSRHDPFRPFAGLFTERDWRARSAAWGGLGAAERAAAVGEAVLGQLREGRWLLLDDHADEGWDVETRRVARLVLEGARAEGESGAMLWARPGLDAAPAAEAALLHLQLQTLGVSDLRDLFGGLEPILHEPARAATALWDRTQGIPPLIRAELQRWEQLGWTQRGPQSPRLQAKPRYIGRRVLSPPILPGGAWAPDLAQIEGEQGLAQEVFEALHLVWPHSSARQLARVLKEKVGRVNQTLGVLKRRGAIRTDLVEGEPVHTPLAPSRLADLPPADRARLLQGAVRCLPPEDPRRITLFASIGPRMAAREALSLGGAAHQKGNTGLAINRLQTALELSRRPVSGATVREQARLQSEIFSAWFLAALGDGRRMRLQQVRHQMQSSSNPSVAVDELLSLTGSILSTFYPSAGNRGGIALANLKLRDLYLEGLRRVIRFAIDGTEPLLDGLLGGAGDPGAAKGNLDPRLRADLEARLQYARGKRAYDRTQYEESAEHYLASARLRPESAWRGGSLDSAAASLAETERLDEAAEYVARAIRLSVDHEHPAFEARARWVERLIAYRRGEDLSPDPALLRATHLCGDLRTEAPMGLTEAAFAWRRAQASAPPPGAREDLGRALEWLNHAAACAAQTGQVDTELLARAFHLVLSRGPRPGGGGCEEAAVLHNRVASLAEQVASQAPDPLGVETLGLLGQVVDPIEGAVVFDSLRQRMREQFSFILRDPRFLHRFDRRGNVISWSEALRALKLPDSPREGGPAERALADELFLKLFDEPELRRFVRTHRGGLLDGELPGVGSPKLDVAEGFARGLLARGLADHVLFDDLLKHRPGQEDMIKTFRATWPF